MKIMCQKRGNLPVVQVSAYPFILLTLFFLFQGCSEDEDSELTIKELIAGTHSKSWMIERYSAYGISKKPDDCNTDDEFVFYTNYVVQYRSNKLKCNSNDPDIAEGNWSLSDDEQTITITVNQLEGDGTIDLLTPEKLKVTTKEGEVPVTITFSAKK